MEHKTRKKAILKMIADAKNEILDASWEMYDYKTMPDKRRKDLLSFDPNLDFDDFVAVYATTVFGFAKDGLLFTTYGIYFDDVFTKKYVNYIDISKTSWETGFLGFFGVFSIFVESEEKMSFSYDLLKKDTGCKALTNLLINLRSFALMNDDGGNGMVSGKVQEKQISLTEDEIIKCNAIIHTASLAAGGVGGGMAQLPAADAAVLIPIQVTMIMSLGGVFGLNIVEGAAKGIISAFGATIAGRAVSQFLLGWLPGIGNIINATTAAGLTEVIGWYAADTFKKLAKSRFEGMKDGFVKAGREFEKKLRNQASEFIKKAKVFEKERDEFTKLLAEYSKLIVEYEIKASAGDKESAIKSNTLKNELGTLSTLPLEN